MELVRLHAGSGMGGQSESKCIVFEKSLSRRAKGAAAHRVDKQAHFEVPVKHGRLREAGSL